MRKIAVLITCHNRKDKTIACLSALFSSFQCSQYCIDLKVYITDDGSTDGTKQAIIENFKEKPIEILQGNGDLFWAGGTRNSWKNALIEDYDGYLLLNDDTIVHERIFDLLLKTHDFAINKYRKGGIYIGTTSSCQNSDIITYGGKIIINRWKVTGKRVIPNGIPQPCDWGNGNIMLVAKGVVKDMGILHEGFKHGIADYDYTLQAGKKNIPVLVAPAICGKCDNDNQLIFDSFCRMTFKERIKYTFTPLGFALSDYLLYIKRNFWYRYPIVFFACWLKIIAPGLYLYINEKVR